MKTKILLVTLTAVLLGIVIGTIRSLAQTTLTFAFVVPKAITAEGKLPDCIPSVGDCRWKLWRNDRQASNPAWQSFDLYAKYRGKVYHAHAWRTGDASRWLWVVQGHEYWLKAIRRYKADNPTHVTQGPALLEKIRNDQAVCDVVAPLVFVNVTTDGGALKQPNPIRHSCNKPTDGGVSGDCTITQTLWPDGGAIANCAGAFWLARCRFGGAMPAGQVEADAGFLTDAVGSPGAVTGVQERINVNNWIAPDARVYHTCTLPIGQSCP